MGTEIIQISGYDDLISLYEKERKNLASKSDETKWHRYIFHRVPLFFGFGFIAHLILAALMISGVFKSEEKKFFILSLLGLIYDLYALLAICIFILFCFFGVGKYNYLRCKNFPKKYNKVVDECDYCQKCIIYPGGRGIKILISKFIDSFNLASNVLDEKSIRNLVTFFLLFIVICLFLFTLSLCTENYKFVYFNPIIFGIITFGSLLIDKNFGYTRRYERYKFFSNEALSLAVINRSRKTLKIPIGEEHLKECGDFFRSLRQDKQQATLDDSFYLLQHLERFNISK